VSRILFVGDLQLGAGQQYGTPERSRLADQAEAWDWIVDSSDDWFVDKVVLLGDVFDKRHPNPDELIAFQKPLRKLREAGIDTLAITGNHDITTESAATPLDVFADLLDVHRTPGVWGNIATLPWTPPHRLAAAHGRDQLNERVAAHLVECARELRPGAGKKFFPDPQVLVLHWSISGGVTASGVETIDLAEPVLPLEDLLSLGYDWIVAGHIHQQQILSGFAERPTVLVAGSPMVNDFGEAEGQHGVWIIDTGDSDYEFQPVPDRRFVTLESDIPEAAWLVKPPDIEGAVVRVRYTATPEQAAKIDHAAIERALYDAGAHKVYSIEPTILRERRARVEHMDESLDPLEALDAWMDAKEGDGPNRLGYRDDLRGYTAARLSEQT